ncbi:putative heptaprenyl diphosphate synthase [Rosa chinensis]|uniref:Alkyl transferase n=1 Tax=Rosa chinensis TaxID=74649 RepID=A0A2P6QJX9_ROSCH|nr:dehydrodolichyl diphosphate synthase 2 [Rosa chinensis]PRQ34472.1 putative heptaprenyl diphosphate synthase [Rosa chinensis]
MLSLRWFPIPLQLSSHFSSVHSKPQLSVSSSLHNAAATATDSTSLKHEVEVEEFLNDGFAPVLEEEALPAGLRREAMPRHVAVIMDGNVRWARRRGLPSRSGHEAGARALRELVDLSRKWGIRVLTVFAFSCDNWVRPKMEVGFLMSLFEGVIKSEINSLAREGIRISVIGDSSKLPDSLQKLISEAEEKTKDNFRLQLIVAVNYSGKYDVVQACKSISQKVKDGLIQVEDINESVIEQELETNCTEFPYPDLLIRTSGELRVSNFMLWQLAYTELLFVPALWPDFGKAEFAEALISFQQRQRRYGRRDL